MGHRDTDSEYKRYVVSQHARVQGLMISIIWWHAFPGSLDTSCVGLVSSSGNAMLIEQELDAERKAASAKTKRRQAVVTGVCLTLGLISFAVMCLAGYIYRRRCQHRLSAQFIEVKPVIDPPYSSSQSDGERVIAHSEAKNVYGTVISSPAITTDKSGETIPLPKQVFLLSPPPLPRTIKSPHFVTLTYQPQSDIQQSASRANAHSTRFTTFPVSPFRLNDQRAPSDMQHSAPLIEAYRWRDRQHRKVHPHADGGMYDGVDNVNIHPSSLPPPPYIDNRTGRQIPLEN